MYTAADIEKYHKGQLSPAEMHAMERAALEDPLLADALEGYVDAGQYLDKDLEELRLRLADRLREKSETPVVPLPPADKTSSMPWWRIAAAAVVLIGMGWGIYQWTSGSKNQNIAQSPETSQSDQENNLVKEPAYDSNTAGNELPSANDYNRANDFDESPKISPAKKPVQQPNEQPVSNQSATPGEKSDADAKTLAPSAAPVVEPTGKNKQQVSASEGSVNSQAAETESFAKQRNRSANPFNEEERKKESARANKAQAAMEYRFDDRSANLNRVNLSDSSKMPFYVFRGKVVDNDNNPLPFTNITNQKDQVGTYADANGNFVLISSDSVLNVQTRSVGFVTDLYALRDRPGGNKLVLTEDESVATRTIDTSFRIANLARLGGNLRHEEPEPVDGWSMYDVYIANNMVIADDVKPRINRSSTVELSFEVDKLGQPVNIRVVKSLCPECDQEAIRLLKEGPRWKPTRKNRRTKVTISF